MIWSRTARESSVDEDRFGDVEQLALAPQLALEGRGLGPQRLRGVRIGHGLGGEAAVDDEEAKVVVAELVQAELGQDEDAEDAVLEDHRREEHRLVEVGLGPGDRVGPRVRRRVGQVLGDLVLGHPAGDPLAEVDLELLRRLVDVLADLAEHRDRDEVLLLEPVDADVVVVDELAELGRDGLADLADARQAVEPRAELLDRLELGRPGRHLAVVLGGLDGHRRLGGEGRHRVELTLRPGVRSVVVDVEQPEQFGAVEERHRAQGVEALLDHRRPHRRSARIVGVAGRIERLPGDHGRRGERWRREVADRGEVLGRQPPGDLGHDPAVGSAQEDRHPVGLEEDRGVVGQPAQHLLEVEPPADIAGDPPQGIEPVDLLGGVVEEAGRVDADADLPGDGVDELGVGVVRPSTRWADDDEDAPARLAGEDRDGDLGRRAGDERLPAGRVGAEQERPVRVESAAGRAERERHVASGGVDPARRLAGRGGRRAPRRPPRGDSHTTRRGGSPRR